MSIAVLTSNESGANSLTDINANFAQTAIGPASAISNGIPKFNGTTGKIVKDSGIAIGDVGATFANFQIIQPPAVAGTGTGVGLYGSDSTNAAGGGAYITGGSATSGNNAGGDAAPAGGVGFGSGAGGYAYLTGGVGGVTGAGGGAIIAGGAGGATSGNGGPVTITGGAATNGNGNGGNITITGGAKNGSGVAGTVTITKPVINATNPTAQTYTPAGGGTATLDLSLANQHYITMPAGNATIALSNDTNNQIFLVSITQDSGGSRTVTWFTTIKWAGGGAPTLTTTANKRDTFGFIRTGSGTYDGFVIGQNI